MLTLLIATRNLHKVQEIRAILGEELAYQTLADIPQAPQTVEDAGTFAGNATKKAVELAKWLAARPETPNAGPNLSHGYVLADDSGLEVDPLGGAPGVHSARFAALDSGQEGNSSTAENNAKLLRLLRGVPPVARTARFRCVVALTPVVRGQRQAASPVCDANEPELLTELFEGTCEGQILSAPRGQRGFGYDPLFVPTGYDRSFAELSEAVKNQLSHRAKALAKLKAFLADRGPKRGHRC